MLAIRKCSRVVPTVIFGRTVSRNGFVLAKGSKGESEAPAEVGAAMVRQEPHPPER